jgi:hypothetical protein
LTRPEVVELLAVLRFGIILTRPEVVELLAVPRFEMFQNFNTPENFVAK